MRQSVLSLTQANTYLLYIFINIFNDIDFLGGKGLLHDNSKAMITNEIV